MQLRLPDLAAMKLGLTCRLVHSHCQMMFLSWLIRDHVRLILGYGSWGLVRNAYRLRLVFDECLLIQHIHVVCLFQIRVREVPSLLGRTLVLPQCCGKLLDGVFTM